MGDGHFDLYTHLPVATDVTIQSVTFWVRARLEAPSMQPVQVAPGWRLNNIPGWDDLELTTSWADYSTIAYVRQPDTNAAWTIAALNDMALGVRKSYGERVRVTRVWATIACQ